MLVIVLWYSLQLPSDHHNATLKNKSVPVFALPSLEGPVRTLHQTLFAQHKVTLLNVWASWCLSCEHEHRFLLTLNQHGVNLIGLNWKDEREDALIWLNERGSPYQTVIYDQAGVLAMDLGVTGVPETFVIDGSGVIRYILQGPLSAENYKRDLLPVIQKWSKPYKS